MGLVNTAVRRPVTVWMFTFAILLFGMVSLSRLAVNLLPELSYPTLTIRTDYDGAAPAEVEQLVSKPIEEAIGVVKGVKRMKSISRAGQSDVILEFEWGTNMDTASLDVREKLDVTFLPLDVKKPILLRFNPSLDPIIRLGLVIDAQPNDVAAQNALKQARIYAEEQLKRKLEAIEGVAAVRLGGGYEQQIHVLLDPQKTAQLNLTPEHVVNTLKAENVNFAGGRVRTDDQEFLVRTLNQFKTLDNIRDLYIKVDNGQRIRLGDIAEVSESHKERDAITRIDGLENIDLALYKEGGANTVQVALRVQRALTDLAKQLPSGYKLTSIYDQSGFIKAAIDEVKSNALVGGLLAMAVLYLFLRNAWTTLVISISIPVSVVATFNLMYFNGISLNIMSLGGIALAVGLLVDNAIVVLENITKHKEAGASAWQAAVKGTQEVSTAITASTLTTVAVFVPLVFVEGIAGQLFGDQALTVTYALLASLLIALTLVPMMAAREPELATDTPAPVTQREVVVRTGWRKAVYWLVSPVRWLLIALFRLLPFYLHTLVVIISRAFGKLVNLLLKPLLWAFEAGFNGIAAVYQKLLAATLKAPVTTLAAILAVTGLSYSLAPRLGMELIPNLAQGELYYDINLPMGTPISQTDATLGQLQQAIATHPAIAHVHGLAGTGSLLNSSPAQGGDNWGRLSISLKANSSAQTQLDIQHLLRERAQQVPGLEGKFAEPELFSFATPIAVELSGYDLEALMNYSQQVSDAMTKTGHFVDVKSSLRVGQPELKIYFDHSKLAQLGLTPAEVAKRVATMVGGSVASQYSIFDRKVDILVRVQEQHRNSLQDIQSLIVNPGQDKPLTLGSVATLKMQAGPSEITRLAQERVAVITANLAGVDLQQATALLTDTLATLPKAFEITAKVTGQSEEMQNSYRSLYMALALAVFMVYLVMASQFESLLHPLLILFTVPLAGAGSILGLFITQTHVSVIVFIGLIMLAGIVVNNAIVLIDKINQLREQGEDKAAAILAAGQSRLRPILMTTLTTVLGLLPLALGLGDGAEIRAPMAITVIFGLCFATLLTLLFIPALYWLFDRKSFKQEAV